MSRVNQGDRDLIGLDELIAGITPDGKGDDAKLRAFRATFEDHVTVPCDGFVIGEPVSVIEFEYDGHERRGLTAKCRRTDGSEHVVSAADVVLARQSGGARYVAAYRRWLGLEPFPPQLAGVARRGRIHEATSADFDLSGLVELVTLSVKDRAARCRLPGSDRIVTLRAGGCWDLVPGEIVVVKPHKQWSYGGYAYLSGEIESTRLDVRALGLVPLRLEDQGVWDPKDEYWGEECEPIEAWAKPIIARGPRPAFEMEQVLPGSDPDDPDTDRIMESNESKDAGDHDVAHRILMELCQADLRCLDAHAHLGNLVSDGRPEKAMRHYAAGLSIGELSTGGDFGGVLPWGCIDNRPFLRCMHGFGLCLWRLGRFEEAERVFDRMLWMNPSDNQGVRFLLDEVRARTVWQSDACDPVTRAR